MEYKAEFIKDCIEELKTLTKMQWEEVSWFKGQMDYKPDFESYVELQDSNRLLFTTVREKGRLIGYNINFISRHLHYSDHLFAANDVIYILPKYRKTGVAKELLTYTETILKHIGVSFVTISMKEGKGFKSLAESVGFEHQENLYSKFIGE